MKRIFVTVLFSFGVVALASGDQTRTKKETFTGTVEFLTRADPHPGGPLYMVNINLENPKPGYDVIMGISIFNASELKIGGRGLRSGDVVTFDGYRDVLFSTENRAHGGVRLSTLENLRIVGHREIKIVNSKVKAGSAPNADPSQKPFDSPLDSNPKTDGNPK
jgi:hypothetical protein